MIVIKEPKLEIKGLFVFLEEQLLEPKIFRYNEMPFHIGMENSTRVVFSYTPVKRYGIYEYGILNITHGLNDEMPAFACHKANDEIIMNLQGNTYCYCFDYARNDMVRISEARPKKWQNLKANGFLTIINTGNINAIFLMKIKPPLANTDEFKKNKGPPIMLTKKEKIKNYNYLVWGSQEMQESKANILEELYGLLNKKF
ncbi:MAG: hypothetical protein QXI89_00585 [Candidatus Anstonellales archaeon]